MIGNIIDIILHVDKYLKVLIDDFGGFVYLFLFLIVFMETGLVVTPFLPGDSLLFVAGTFAAAGSLSVYILFLLLSLAAIIGDTVNYWLGSYFGEKIFRKFINREYMERTKLFYEKHGAKTIVLARYIPVIRTFAPFVAGIGKMKYSRFLIYNIAGGIAWVALFVFSGYFFGSLPFVKNHLTAITYLIIFISLIPVLVEYVRHRNKSAK